MKTLTNQAYTHIRNCLIRGELPAGSRLSEVEIARTLGVSRTPVREAIAQLVSQGLIEQPPGSGPRVKVVERRELEELFELREMLECGAVALAAPQITNAELAGLDELHRQYLGLDTKGGEGEPATDLSPLFWVRGSVLDMAFHLRIMEAARNRRLLQLVGDLHILTRILRRRADRTDYPQWRRRSDVLGHHGSILEALRQRDAEGAERAMRSHIRSAKEYHLIAFDWQQREGGLDADDFLPKDVLNELQTMEDRAAGRPETDDG